MNNVGLEGSQGEGGKEDCEDRDQGLERKQGWQEEKR